MPTTTGVVLRQRLSEVFGDYQSLTTSAAGNSEGTTLVDSDLANLSGDDDFCLNWYVLITSLTNSGQSRRVSAYTATAPNTTIRVQSAFTGSVADAVTYELHRYDPVDKRNALNRAIEELFPFLYLPVRDETLVVDDRLSNSDFETFASGSFTSWTAVNAPTLAAETTRVIHGAQSASVTSGASAGQLYQQPTLNIKEVTGKTATFKAWVYTTATSTARLRLDWDGTNITNSSYHTGEDRWELLSVTASVPSTATRVRAICEVVASGSAFFDAAWLAIGAVYRYTLPTTIIVGPTHVYQQYDEGNLVGPYYHLPADGIPTAGRRLRLVGQALLARPASDTATIEVGEPYVSLIVAKAAWWLSRMLAQKSATQQRDRFLQDMQFWAVETERLKAQRGMRIVPPGVENAHGKWLIERVDTTRYLVLAQNR